jgi:parallel beta-helix repeat protein
MSNSPGIFLVDGLSTAPGSGGSNASILQATIDLAQASGNPSGAIVLIPSFASGSGGGGTAYPLAPPSGTTIITIPGGSGYESSPLLICGTGNGTQLSIDFGSDSSSNTVFDIGNTASVTFQDLDVAFNRTFSVVGTAFGFSGGANHKLFRILVNNCEYPVVFDGTAGASMLQCQFVYSDSYPAGKAGTAVKIIGASQTTLNQCLFFYAGGFAEDDTLTIQITDSSDTRITDTQCSSFATGITIGSSSSSTLTTGVSFTGVRVDAFGSCVNITPNVFDVSFTDCHFQAGGNWPPSGTSSLPGIGVGTLGDANSTIDTVRFTGCTLTGNTAVSNSAFYGMQIAAGQNIQILGGNYSGNGETAGIAISGGLEIQIIGANCVAYSADVGTYQLYGISIEGGQDVQIINVNCSGSGIPSQAGTGIYINGSEESVENVRVIGAVCNASVQGSPSNQAYGIQVISASNVLLKECSIAGSSSNGIYLENASNVTIDACDVSANNECILVDNGTSNAFIRDCNVTPNAGGTAISFASSLSSSSHVEVTNCAGYNDQKTLLYGPGAPPSAVFSGITLNRYFGPTVFYISSGGTGVTIDTYATGLSTGGFTLALGETAQIAGTSGQFFMIGN